MRKEATQAYKGWALDTVTIYNEGLKQKKEEITASPSVCMTCKVLISVFNLYRVSFSHFGLLEEKVTIVFTSLVLLSTDDS